MAEWKPIAGRDHQRAVSQDEIRAIIHVIGITAACPQALECFRARKVLTEENLTMR
jgi:4-carboxymuconolactone decarboxylase